MVNTTNKVKRFAYLLLDHRAPAQRRLGSAPFSQSATRGALLPEEREQPGKEKRTQLLCRKLRLEWLQLR
jgi:hypothetical protein